MPIARILPDFMVITLIITPFMGYYLLEELDP
jgi:hypothetical protein